MVHQLGLSVEPVEYSDHVGLEDQLLQFRRRWKRGRRMMVGKISRPRILAEISDYLDTFGLYVILTIIS